MSKSGIAVIALAAALAWPARPARGQFSGPGAGSSPNIEGFTVAGKATVMARPNAVEIDLSVSAGSELTADAIVKYRDARRKLRDAFAALKLKDVAVEERGLRVDQKGTQASPYFFDYTPNQRTKTEVQLSRKLVVRGSELRKMDEDAVLQLVAKLLDVAQDAGGHVGGQEQVDYYSWRFGSQGNSLVRFVVDDFEKLEEQAYEKAIADARARAERLARLSKVELGPIVAVREVVVPGEGPTNTQDDYPYFYYRPAQRDNDEGQPRKRLEASKFQDIPVRVELLVRFGIITKAEPNGRTANR
jgi:uncharacterized protein YggE